MTLPYTTPEALAADTGSSPRRVLHRMPRQTKMVTMNEPAEIGGHVYFVRSGDFIKIGWSSHFVRRVDHLRGMAPQHLELVGILEGGRKLERLLHRQFAAQREHREWFRYEGALAEYIEQRTTLKLWTMSNVAREYADSFAKAQDQE